MSPNEAKISFETKIIQNSLILNAELTVTLHFSMFRNILIFLKNTSDRSKQIWFKIVIVFSKPIINVVNGPVPLTFIIWF